MSKATQARILTASRQALSRRISDFRSHPMESLVNLLVSSLKHFKMFFANLKLSPGSLLMQSIHIESRPRTHPPTDNQQPRSSKQSRQVEQADDSPRKARWVVRRPTRISIFDTAGHAAIMKNNFHRIDVRTFRVKKAFKNKYRPCSAGELAEWLGESGAQ